MKKTNKKGFTIVELVVVIAIIAILAAVLIPTFANLIKRANISKDQQLVRNLNTALIADAAINGKHQTMHDAVEALKASGFDVAKINDSKAADNEILWDSKNDLFCYLNDGKVEYLPENDRKYPLNDENAAYDEAKVNYVDLFAVASDVTEDDRFSIYLYDYKGTTGVINTHKGFDAGDEAGIVTVNYTNTAKQNVIIRTNGGTLTVNALPDTVKHYGNADKVDVQEIANASYHEFGDVDLVKVKKGHVELEQGSAVLGIYVYNDSTETVKATSFEDIKITVNQGVEVPALSRSAVEIQDGGTKVCTIVTDEAKDVYLFNEGIYQQIKVVDEGKAITDESATWADDNSNSANTQTAAQQLANELNATVTVDNVEYTVAVDTESENRELVVTVKETGAAADSSLVNSVKENAVNQSGSTEEDAVADLPLRGDGLSWETAFEIYDYNTMQKINDYAGEDRYFKVVIEKTDNGHIDLENWSYIYMDGHFDGSGVIFDNLDCVLFYGPYASEQFDAKNFTISESCSISGWRTGTGVLYYGAAVNHLTNITVHGYIQGSDRASAFVGWGNYSYGTQSWYFDNCYSDATLVGNDIGGFIAHPYNDNGQTGTNNIRCFAYAYFNDSLFEGVMQAPMNKTPNYINGNNSSAKAGSAVYMNFSSASLLSRFNAVCKSTLGINDNGNGYTYTYGANNSATPFNSMSDYTKRTTMTTTYHTLEGMSLGDSFSVSKNENATKAIITLNVGPNGKTESGNFVGTFLKDEFTSLTEDTITSQNVKYYTVAINPIGVDETGVSGTQLNIVNSNYGTTYGSLTVSIAQYNSNGYLVQMDVWDLTK